MNAVFSENSTRVALPPLMCVGPAHLKSVWHFAEPLIRAAYARMDEFVPTNLYQWLEKQKGLLWVGIRDNAIIYAMTTSLEAHPSGLWLRICAMGGEDVDHMRDCENILAKYARDEGCVKIVFDGRNGWGRASPGYKATRSFFEKAL